MMPEQPSENPGSQSELFALPRGRGRRLALHWKILIGMLIGAAAGLSARAVLRPMPDGSVHPWLEFARYYIAEPMGQIFLRLIFMVVLPLVYTALVLGVTGLGDLRRLGRLGLRTFAFTLIFSSLSVIIGITLVNTLRPGTGLTAEQRIELNQRYAQQSERAVTQARQAKPLRDMLLDLIPTNPIQEMVGALDGSARGGGMLAVMFFALASGVALSMTGEKAKPVIDVLEGVYEAVLKIVAFAMRLAPLGVAGLMFSLTSAVGGDILHALAWYALTVLAGLAIHTIVVYSAAVRAFAGMSPLWFFKRTSEASLTAFATSSSNATLPTSLRVTETRLGVRRDVCGFVLTIGSTANQNGTALYEGVTVLFLAQVFGVDLNAVQQLTVVLMSIVAGIGTAGIPGGSLPLVVVVLQSVGVPPQGIAVIFGVDRLLDMCRTAVNVIGDIAIAACVDGRRADRLAAAA